MNAVDLASLLCSRLCHDLLSPVGALNNGIELLADEQDPEMRERCLELLAESARASANKLKFFRLAFGAGGRLRRRDRYARGARPRSKGCIGADRRIELGWMVADDKLPKGAVKLLLNLALIAGDALVRGGRLDVGAEQRDGALEIVIRAEGPRILLDPSCARRSLQGQLGRRRSNRAPPAPGWRTAWRRRRAARSSSRDPADEVLLIGVTLPASA